MRDTLDDNGAVAQPGQARRAAGWPRRLVRAILPCLWTALFKGSLVLVVAALVPALLVGGALLAMRTIDPPGSALMLAHRLSGGQVDQRWVPLSEISPNLVRAVIASEDNQFCRHHGVDLRELEVVLEQLDAAGEEGTRGGSTVTMQVAKNLFLWSARSYVRKAIEIPLAYGMEQIWTKHRIMEVYLNIAEWGPGVFGAEAAARYHFNKPASRLTEREAALLAVALPNPGLRVPSSPTQRVLRVASLVERRARLVGPRAGCVLDSR
jgi:monofunctional biosynthetic peptidoglycan transglycosylase